MYTKQIFLNTHVVEFQKLFSNIRTPRHFVFTFKILAESVNPQLTTLSCKFVTKVAIYTPLVTVDYFLRSLFHMKKQNDT